MLGLFSHLIDAYKDCDETCKHRCIEQDSILTSLTNTIHQVVVLVVTQDVPVLA